MQHQDILTCVATWLTRNTHPTLIMEEVMEGALSVRDPALWHRRGLRTRVGIALARCGWRHRRRRFCGQVQWLYVKAETSQKTE